MSHNHINACSQVVIVVVVYKATTRGGKGEVKIQVKVGVLLCSQLFICFFVGTNCWGEGIIVGLMHIYDNTFILPRSVLIVRKVFVVRGRGVRIWFWVLLEFCGFGCCGFCWY